MDLAYWKDIIKWDKFIIHILPKHRTRLWTTIRTLLCIHMEWMRKKSSILINIYIYVLTLNNELDDVSIWKYIKQLTFLVLFFPRVLLIIVECIYSCAVAREVLLSFVWEHVCRQINERKMWYIVIFLPSDRGRWNAET
jgi:hypothetical protein